MTLFSCVLAAGSCWAWCESGTRPCWRTQPGPPRCCSTPRHTRSVAAPSAATLAQGRHLQRSRRSTLTVAAHHIPAGEACRTWSDGGSAARSMPGSAMLRHQNCGKPSTLAVRKRHCPWPIHAISRVKTLPQAQRSRDRPHGCRHAPNAARAGAPLWRGRAGGGWRAAQSGPGRFDI